MRHAVEEIIVTGGAKGIGEGIAELLAGEGAIAVIAGRIEEDNNNTARAIEANNGRAFQVVAELSNPSECENAVKKVAAQCGRIDGLVKKAGVNDGLGLENGAYMKFMESLHRNLVHYFLMAHYSLPSLKAITARMPLGNRMITAEEIANAVALLLSERSGHTTGQLIHVDGDYVQLDRALTNNGNM
jgi:NAD(P)-dependent dehydrogenase (short-subunit alcohol dehydrogenase family)